MATKSGAVEKAEPELVISKVFDAPRELVFKAWTEPERMKRWAVPDGFTMPICKIDPRPGGGFHYCRRSSEGLEYWQKGFYREVVVPERLVLTEFRSDQEGNMLRHPANPNWPPQLSSTLTFSEQEGKTAITIRMVPHSATEAERKTFAAAQELLQTSIGAVLDKLAEYVWKACAQ
jgi:uncharacterized protein YndB with AHSA1/START domain